MQPFGFPGVPLTNHSLQISTPMQSSLATIVFRSCLLLMTTIGGILLSPAQLRESSHISPQIDAYAHQMMQRFGIPGMTVAVVKEGKILHQGNYGFANIEHAVPVHEKTLFKLHSLTKIFVATAVFRLIAEGRLSLEDSIGTYLDDLPQSWEAVQIQHLLTHSSGLPDVVEVLGDSEQEARDAVYRLPLEVEPGDHFRYNQTNYWLLNRIIRHLTQTSLDTHILATQFGDTSSKAIFAGAQFAIVPNRATEYKPNEEGVLVSSHFSVAPYMYGAAGLSLRMQDFIHWDQQFDKGALLSSTSKDRMWSNFSYRGGGEAPFGWARSSLNGQVSYGFNGGGVACFRKYPTADVSVIVLSNGYQYSFDVEKVVSYIASISDSALADTSVMLTEQIWSSFFSVEFQDAMEKLRKIHAEHPHMELENSLNSLGYSLARRGRLEDAIALFLYNTELNSDSWNVWDSLGEGYEMAGDKKLALRFYQKSLELNPENWHAREKVTLLKE